MKKTKNITTKIESNVFDKNVFNETGVFVWKQAIPEEIVLDLQNQWKLYYSEILKEKGGRVLDTNNVVNFKETLPEALNNFWKSEYIKKVAVAVWGENVALYNHRIVMKDKNSDQTVFLHQDYCYHIGFPEKCSLFIPLFECGEKEGGMTYYLGTHQYGYLGDAGEVDDKQFDQWPQVLPNLKPGDIAIMNSSVWHKSGPNKSDNERVLFDIIIQPSNDPSGTDLIAGEWETDFWIEQRKNKDFMVDWLFVNSRSKKLKNLNK